MSDREAFEKWVTDNCIGFDVATTALERSSKGWYIQPITFAGWEAWQAALSAAPNVAETKAQALEAAATYCDEQYERDKPLQKAGGQDNADNYISGYIDGSGDCGHGLRNIAAKLREESKDEPN